MKGDAGEVEFAGGDCGDCSGVGLVVWRREKVVCEGGKSPVP